MDWTGSEIHQLSGFWTGLDPEMCNVYPIFRDVRQFLLIVTLMSEVLPSYLRLYTSSFVFTCRFYKVFSRYLLCCVRIGLDWIQIPDHQLDWTGLGSVTRGFGLDWIVSTESIPYSGCKVMCETARAHVQPIQYSFGAVPICLRFSRRVARPIRECSLALTPSAPHP